MQAYKTHSREDRSDNCVRKTSPSFRASVNQSLDSSTYYSTHHLLAQSVYDGNKFEMGKVETDQFNSSLSDTAISVTNDMVLDSKGILAFESEHKSKQRLNSLVIISSKPKNSITIYQNSRNELKCADWVAEFSEKLNEMSCLKANWDSYGAEPPNEVALDWARKTLEILSQKEFSPTQITPSVENGIGISFIHNNKYADIECFNEGEILAVISDGQGDVKVWEVEISMLGLSSAIDKIYAFFQ